MKEFEYIEQLIIAGDSKKPGAHTNFRINIDGYSFSNFEGAANLGSSRGVEIEQAGSEYSEHCARLFYNINGASRLKVTVCYEEFENTPAVRQTVTVENTGDSAVTINHISSAVLDGFGADGLLPWKAPGRFILHTCDTAWQGEAQWRAQKVTDLGLVPTTTHSNMKNYRISSVGSWTTHRYYPMAVLEDTETGRSFFIELEPVNAWCIELNNISNGFAQDGVLGFEANCADIHHDNWQLTLKAGESYTAQPCVYGMTDGGFDEAVACLTAYKRASNAAPFKDNVVPVAFNCYMNCIWSKPTSQTLIPLIDACADAGVEVFCIDAGWFRCFDDPSKNGIGDYNIADDRFPGYTLKGIFDYIKSKNLVPGIWLEVECCQEISRAYNLSGNCLCMRGGKPVGGARAFFNFREPAVCEHIMSVIDKLYGMGVRFIKNDYNQTTGAGFSNYGGSYSAEAAESMRALIEFFRCVRNKYADLIIENCSSGAMRSDNYMLQNFELQSTSDQELYYRNSSIASGSLACMLPEKAGIWAYPYPSYCNEPADKCDDEEAWIKKRGEFADGEQTVYNMVNGLIGNLYLSGRIDRCDEKNRELISEGVALFKKNRTMLVNAVPVWPSGTFTIDAEGMFCTGLLDKQSGRMLLAVWNINAHKKTAVFDLSKWFSGSASAKIAYPAADTVAACEYHPANGKLSVTLPDIKYSARLIEINP